MNQDKIKRRAKVNQVYIKDTDGNFKFVDMDKIKLSNGVTLLEYIDTTTKYYEDVSHNIDTVINLLKDAQFVYPDREYRVVGERNGYIAQGTKYVVELTVDEVELYKGYCKIVKEGNVLKVEIDERQKQRYLKTFEGGKVV